ncbi:olfactory receptor 146-like [Alosa sapidissima]|uniref:olfactory receptor 146-like n=1 Tax=Alosa sapidissima TaxID=34773 RepID=UPI001C08BF37|nr:olfactory receptor 146-like [Alosa sapidissima]
MNGSSVTFTFTAYEEIGPTKDMLFVIIFLIYLASVLANMSLMVLIYLDASLHKPMYIFLFSLIFNGLIGSTAVWPKVMGHLVTDVHSASYEACLTQTFFVFIYGSCTYAMLTVMAYDRYVSIFQPLLYHTIMTPQKVRVLLVVGNFLPAAVVFGQICLTSGIPLCRYSIHKIFCDNLSVSNLGCSLSTYALVTNLYGACSLVFLIVLPILLILLSYLKIIVLSSKVSADARKKAFATCTPHLLIFLNFSVSLLFSVIYNRITHYVPIEVNIFLSSHYILIPPLIHPIIYGLKNQEIKKSLSKVLRSCSVATGFLTQPKKSPVFAFSY